MSRRTQQRRGTTAVEAAIILPIFFIFLISLFEYGRMVMMDNALDAACRQAARYGATEGVSTNDAITRVQDILDSTMDTEQLAVVVKDASVFDSGGDIPLDSEEINDMSSLELNSAESRQLFCVHASVAYNNVAMLPLPFTYGVTLSGTSYMRHE